MRVCTWRLEVNIVFSSIALCLSFRVTVLHRMWGSTDLTRLAVLRTKETLLLSPP